MKYCCFVKKNLRTVSSTTFTVEQGVSVRIYSMGILESV